MLGEESIGELIYSCQIFLKNTILSIQIFQKSKFYPCMTPNISGRNKSQLDPKIMSYIKSTAFKYFPSLHSDITKEQAECVVAIDESCRRLKNKPKKRSKHWFEDTTMD